MVKLLLVAAIALASCSLGTRQDSGSAENTYLNPVLDRDFPDPAVLKAPDGWFYAYATQSISGSHAINIQVARSRDLVQWAHLGEALPGKPVWAAGKQKFWAPHVIHDREQQRYLMYYSAERSNAEGKCLAVATAEAPAGPFADSGEPLLCGEDIENIDPMAFDDPRTGKRLLYWGSGAKPIKVRELAPDRLSFMPGSTATELIFPDQRKEYQSLIEGAWIMFRGETYFLFYSGDRCCTREPRYAIMVARSGNALGPFEHLSDAAREGSNAILENSGFWLAPGHNSVVTDDEGVDWLLYHAVDPERRYFEDLPRGKASPRVMLLDRIIYRDGWPRVDADRPSNTSRHRPAIGRGR